MGDSTPICRCRVLYLGSAVPRQSKDGLQGIQEPLRSLYPSEGAVGAKGIDSWLSVWSNGILLENVDENLKEITRFFPIESLHYCAAVRQVLIPERGNTNPEPKFLPLDSPFARMPRAQHPPIFAAILRRTTGIKVLECHVFICKREAAANALVRCCFHAYADNSYARQLETSSTGGGAGSSVYGTLKSQIGSKSNGDLTSVGLANGNQHHHHHHQQNTASSVGHAGWRSRADSITTLNSVGRQSNGGLLINGGGDSNSSAVEGYTSVKNCNKMYFQQDAYGRIIKKAIWLPRMKNATENHIQTPILLSTPTFFFNLSAKSRNDLLQTKNELLLFAKATLDLNVVVEEWFVLSLINI
uniref:PID domain-containing protein n=1 Tax=Glossina pallidipes TaxID=7398 RepID=A0A1A9ZXQ6_GLOPL